MDATVTASRASGVQVFLDTCGPARIEPLAFWMQTTGASLLAVNWPSPAQFNYVVKAGQKLRKDTKTHQERYIAIDPVTCALLQETLDETTTALAAVGVTLVPSAFLFSNDPAHSRPWNPDWVTHRVRELAKAAGANLDIKGIRHYTASQLLAAGFDLGNTAARLGHSGREAATLKHYADPISEVDRRAAAYLAQLTTRSAAQSG